MSVLAGTCAQAVKKVNSSNAPGIFRLMWEIQARFENKAKAGLFFRHRPHIRYILRLSQVIAEVIAEQLNT
jgi:hypothetical protein